MDLAQAINDRTAAVVYFMFDPQEGVLPLQDVIRIAHSSSVPVIVDAAAENPPTENLWKFYNMGADIVLFSGGKDLGGMNSSGLLIGRKDSFKDACVSALTVTSKVLRVSGCTSGDR